MTASSTTSTRRREARAALDQSHAAHRIRLLEHAVELLDAATEAEDVDLAQTCRGILDALRAHDPRLSRKSSPQPLPAPTWATRTVHEDGGIVHETISTIHPIIEAGHDGRPLPTDVSLSTTDTLVEGRWTRTQPTIQVEGGSYSLDSAHQLRAVIDGLLSLSAQPCAQDGRS